MNTIRKHRWIMTVIMVIVTLAMVGTTILPYIMR